ncbi:MAG TPA: TlpA disulfide reductase family protein [Candidatus Eisenbacteria bacterium]|nr:TlpA disulfide reductase family protein [Candidatus Eisenbacteria bacterium]
MRHALVAGALALLLAVSLTGTGCTTKTTSTQGGAVGTAAPAFALPNLEGKTVRNTDLQGKVVLLNFWATWCPPCRDEVPDFVRLQSKYRDQGLEIVGLSLDHGGAQDVRPFADEYNVNYTMLIASQETADAFGGIQGVPTTFVLDRKGTIVKRFVGRAPAEAFEEAIRPLLAQPAT